MSREALGRRLDGWIDELIADGGRDESSCAALLLSARAALRDGSLSKFAGLACALPDVSRPAAVGGAADGRSEAEEPRSGPNGPDGGRSLLIVDDDPSTRRALSRLFSRKGWRVREAGTIAEGLAHLQREVPYFLVLDLMLPDGDGETLLRWVRGAGLPIRVAVCTAIHDPARMAGVETLAPDLVLGKPIRLDALLAAFE